MALQKNQLIAIVVAIAVIAVAAVGVMMLNNGGNSSESKGGDNVSVLDVGDMISESDLTDLKNKAAKDDKTTLTYKGDGCSVVFNNKAISTLSSAKLEINSISSTSLPSSVQNSIGNDTKIYDFSFGSNTDFGSGQVTVTVDYALPSGSSAKQVTVYYIDSSDKVVTVEAQYKDGKATFTTNHFSKYAIGVEPLLASGGSTYDPNNSNHMDVSLWVYGNADNDNDIDADDLALVKSIATGAKTWVPSENPYADVNFDGKVDSSDVEYLQKILDERHCLVYYDQFFSADGATPWSVSYIHYPYTSFTTYGINYWEQADLMVLLDMWGQVTASESVVCMGDSYAAKYPGVSSLYKFGALSTMDYETVMASGIDSLVAYVAADGTAQKIQKDLRDAKSEIDVVALPMSGVYCVNAVTTAGFLFGCEDNAAKYTAYNDGIVDYMKTNVLENSKITDLASYVVVYNPKDPSRIEIEGTNESTGMPCGGIAFIQLLPGKNIQVYGDAGSAYAYRDHEWFVTQDPDYIIMSGTTKTSGVSHDAAEENFRNFAQVFESTRAYANGNIIGVSYGMTTAYSAYASLVMLAVYMYPEAFDESAEEYAWSILQKWYDDFTYQSINVKDVGGHVTKLSNDAIKPAIVKDAESKVTNRLVIYGNANNDDYLDGADVEFLRAIVSSGYKYDAELFPYLDADQSGTVDSKDVEYLEKILAKSESVKLYYKDTWGGVSSVNYPETTTGNIGTMYWEQASLAVLLGVWDRVTATGSGSLSQATNPGWDKLYSYDSNGGKGYNASTEVVLASATNDAKVVSLIAYMQSDGTAKDIYKAANDSGSTLNVCVPSNANDLSYVLTMGVILGAEERAQKYVSSVDANIAYMEKATSGLTSDTAPTVMVCMIKAATTTDDILVLGPSSAGSANGLYKYMMKTPSTVMEPEVMTNFYTKVKAEWIVEQNPDYILFCSSGAWSGSDSNEVMQEKAMAAASKYFGGTQAYAKGNIICTANGTMNSFIGGFAFLKLISSIYDGIDDRYADQVYDSWFTDGWVNYTLEDCPTYNIRCLPTATASDARVKVDTSLTTPADTLLRIFGNANCDSYINDDDVKYITNIINGNAPQTFYADVNQDGYIDKEDIVALEKIMNGEETTVYYQNYAYETKHCQVPIGKSIVIYYQVLEAVALLDGNVDRCVASDEYTCVDKASQFPGVSDRIAAGTFTNLGNKAEITAEDLMSIDGVTTIITGSATYHITPAVEAGLTADYDVIRLCNGASGFEIVWHVVTLGYLLGSEGGYEYLDFYNKVKGLVDDRVATLDDKDKVDAISVYFNNSTEYKTHNERSGSYEVLETAGANNLAKGYNEKYGGLYWVVTDNEFLYGLEEDEGMDTFIFTTKSTIVGSNQKDFMDCFYNYMKASGNDQLDCYKNGKAIAICYNLTNSTPLCLGFLVESALMYPSLYEDINVYDYLQEFYDHFSLMKFDVTKDAFFFCTSQDLIDAGYAI